MKLASIIFKSNDSIIINKSNIVYIIEKFRNIVK